MTYKKFRNLKVVEQSRYRYKPPPTITLKGQWLQELGFKMGDKVLVKCKDGRLTLTKADEIWEN